MSKKIILMGRDYEDYLDDYIPMDSKASIVNKGYNLTMNLNSARYYVGFRLCKR